MGQKVNPTGLRLGVNRTWDSRWYADDKFTDYLHEDLKIKEFLKEKLAQAGISRIVIERPAKKASRYRQKRTGHREFEKRNSEDDRIRSSAEYSGSQKT